MISLITNECLTWRNFLVGARGRYYHRQSLAHRGPGDGRQMMMRKGAVPLAAPATNILASAEYDVGVPSTLGLGARAEPSSAARPAPVVRQYFPETWLWRSALAEYAIRALLLRLGV